MIGWMKLLACVCAGLCLFLVVAAVDNRASPVPHPLSAPKCWHPRARALRLSNDTSANDTPFTIDEAVGLLETTTVPGDSPRRCESVLHRPMYRPYLRALGPTTRDHGSSPDHGGRQRVRKVQRLSKDRRSLAVGLVPLVNVVECPARRGLASQRTKAAGTPPEEAASL